MRLSESVQIQELRTDTRCKLIFLATTTPICCKSLER